MFIDIATASPPYKAVQSKVKEELKKRMAGQPAIARIIESVSNNSGIETRYFVVPDADESAESKFFSSNGNFLRPGTKRRMEEYEKWSKSLAAEAVKKLIMSTEIDPASIGRIVTVSCTGFYAPGLDYHLINELQLNSDVKRTNIGFMGCAASLIGFNTALEAMNRDGKRSNILLISVELCSLHLQTESTKDNILANLIFADGAAAALFAPYKLHPGIKCEIKATESIIFPGSSDYMGWKIGDFGFEMILSAELPKIILEKAVPALIDILKKNGLNKNDIKHWALHPGGRAILDSLQNGIGLSDSDLKPSRYVLKNHGNMSSATILFVIKEILQSGKIEHGDLICAVAFGPGLSMEVVLMQGIRTE